VEFLFGEFAGWLWRKYNDGQRQFCLAILSFAVGLEWRVRPAKAQWPCPQAIYFRFGFGPMWRIPLVGAQV
jgi:hypothetical protein